MHLLCDYINFGILWRDTQWTRFNQCYLSGFWLNVFDEVALSCLSVAIAAKGSWEMYVCNLIKMHRRPDASFHIIYFN